MAINSINQTANFFGIDRSRIRSNLGEGEVQSINTSESSFAKNAMNIIEEKYSANISSAKATGAEEKITHKDDEKKGNNYSQLDIEKILFSSAVYKKFAGIEDNISEEIKEIKNQANILDKEDNANKTNNQLNEDKDNSLLDDDKKHISADQILKDYYLL